MSVKSRKVLVTGAGGFIGSHLCEELVKAGAEVRALVHYNSAQSHGMLEQLPSNVYESIEVVAGDIRDPFSTRNVVSGCRTVFHLAALIGIPYSYHAPASYVQTNVLGTVNVLQACLTEEVDRLVHTSTSEAYGTAQLTPIDEQHPLQGQSPYSASKIAADKMAESYFLSFGLPVVTMRPFNCYGPRQSSRAFIPAMVSQILKEDKIRCGSLEPFRDYTYVRDTAAAFIACATNGNLEGLTINVGSGQKITMGELLNKIIKIMNVDKEIVPEQQRARPDQSEVMELLCDNSKARRLLNWSPTYTLEAGLRETIEFVEKNIHTYKTSRYIV